MRVFIAITLSLMLAIESPASPIMWTLAPLHFTSTGCCFSVPPTTGTVTGTFTYDADTNTYSNWNIVFSGFSGFPTLPLTPATSTILTLKSPPTSGFGCNGGSTPDPCSLGIQSNARGVNGPNFAQIDLTLFFSSPLTNAGGTVSVSIANGAGQAAPCCMVLDVPSYASFQLDAKGSASTNTRITSALAHYAVGGSFATGFFVTNIGSQAAQFSITAYSDNGSAATLPFSGVGALSTLSGTIPPYGMTYYEAGNPQAPLQGGWGLVTSDQSITVQALFRNHGANGSYYEAAVPPSSGSKEFVVPFDMTTFAATGDQIYIGLAIANLDAVSSASVVCTAKDSKGNVIPNAVSVPVLNPLGHWANYLFPALTGLRGTLDCSSNTTIAAIGLRFLGNDAFSSLPIILK